MCIHTLLNCNSQMSMTILTATRRLPQTHPVSLSLSLFLSNCHYHVNLYQQQTTCTKQPAPNNLYQTMYQQSVPIISSTKPDLITKTNHQNNSQPYAQYHQNVHQPRLLTHQLDVLCHIIHKPSANNTTSKFLQQCTKHVPIMCQLHINYDSSRYTNIINYMSQHVPNMYLNHIPNIYTNITIKSSLAIHHTVHNQIP
jgi:hypothetical protein